MLTILKSLRTTNTIFNNVSSEEGEGVGYEVEKIVLDSHLEDKNEKKLLLI